MNIEIDVEQFAHDIKALELNYIMIHHLNDSKSFTLLK